MVEMRGVEPLSESPDYLYFLGVVCIFVCTVLIYYQKGEMSSYRKQGNPVRGSAQRGVAGDV